MIDALVQGTLAGDPVLRNTGKGDPFVTVSIRVAAGPETLFVGMAAFGETARERLLKLAKGAGGAIAGELQANFWTTAAGAERRDWRLVATEVLSVHQARRRRAEAEEAEA